MCSIFRAKPYKFSKVPGLWCQLSLVCTHQFIIEAAKRKKNFLRIKQLVLIGGPDDGVIMPWQSSIFGFYDYNNNIKKNGRPRCKFSRLRTGISTLIIHFFFFFENFQKEYWITSYTHILCSRLNFKESESSLYIYVLSLNTVLYQREKFQLSWIFWLWITCSFTKITDENVQKIGNYE